MDDGTFVGHRQLGSAGFDTVTDISLRILVQCARRRGRERTSWKFPHWNQGNINIDAYIANELLHGMS